MLLACVWPTGNERVLSPRTAGLNLMDREVGGSGLPAHSRRLSLQGRAELSVFGVNRAARFPTGLRRVRALRASLSRSAGRR